MFSYISLFTGVGGFDLGLDKAGWKCRAQVEIDERCQQILRYRWPNVLKHQDIRNISGYDLPVANAICFGSPCQDLSVAGKRSGFVDGGRSNLFFEAIRIIKEMRDGTAGVFGRFVVWENVTGALYSNNGRDFAAVIDSLADIGAVDIAWRVLDARFFGVPQLRRRVFVVADFGGQCAGSIHSEPESSIWDALQGGSEEQRYSIFDERGFDKTLNKQLLTSYQPVAISENQRAEIRETPYIRQLSTGGGKAGQGYAALRIGDTFRKVTPVECERFMSWPDDHTKYGINLSGDKVTIPDTIRYKMFGNGVVSNIAYWIARQIEAGVRTRLAPAEI
jgi:site-specific DNA-cytosine methylase